MKNWIKKLGNNFAYIIIGIILAIAGGVVYAANVTVPQATQVNQIPMGLSSGNYTNGKFVNSASVTFNTSTPGQISATASGSSGTVSGGTTGFVTTWASSTGLTVGTLRDNATVSGVNATSSTINFNVQGSTTLNPFNVSSSTGISLFIVNTNGSVSVGTTTNNSTFTVQGTSTQPSLNLFNIASSTGTSLLTVNPSGQLLTGVGSSSAPSHSFLSDTASGMYLNTAGTNGTRLGYSGSNNYLQVESSAIYFNSKTYSGINSLTFPSYSFAATALTSGLGGDTSGNIDLITNGTNRLEVLNSNGNVGINTSTPLYKLDVYATAGVNPFNVSSSSNVSLFNIQGNGSTTISSLNNALPVRSTSAGALFNGAINLGGSDVTGILTVPNGGTGANNLTSTDILFGNGTSAVGTSTNLQYVAGLNLFLQNGTGSFVQTSPTSTLISGGLIQNGSVVSYSTSTNVAASVFCNGGGAIVIASSTSGNITLTLPDRDQLNTALTACGATIWPGSLAQQVLFNYSNFSVTTVASGTGESLNPILGSSATIPAGGQGIVFGSFINQNALVTGANGVGTSLVLNIWTTQSTSSAPSIMGQILAADATGRGWGLTNLIAGSNITITTSTPGQITLASSATGGSGTWTVVNGGQYNGTTIASTTDAVLIGTTTAQSLAHVYVQGTTTQTTLDLLNIASSSNASMLVVKSTGLIGISTTTPNALLHVHGDASSTANSALYNLSSTNPILQLGQKPLTSPSANGVYLGINSPSSFSGNFLVFQNNGTEQLRLTSAGAIVALGSIQGQTFANVAGTWTTSGSNVTMSYRANYSGGNAGNSHVFTNTGSSKSPTSGTNDFLHIGQAGEAFNPTSGTATTSALYVGGFGINQTSTANGISRGIFLDQVLTSIYDYRAIEIPSKTTLVSNAASPAQNVYNVLFNPITYQTNSTTKYTIASATTLSILGNPIASTTSLALTNSIGLYINGGAVTASTTNSYGEYVIAATGATNNYGGVWMGGNAGFGTTTPNFGAVFTGTVQMNGLTASAGLQTGVMCLDANGQLINDSVACLASARRFKKDIKPITFNLDELMKYQPVQFNWTKEFNKGWEKDPNKNGIQYSLIADDVQQIDPKMVVVDPKTKEVMGLADLNHWVAKFVSWLQGIEKQIVEIQFKNNEQDTKIQKLEEQNAKQQEQLDKQQRQINLLLQLNKK